MKTFVKIVLLFSVCSLFLFTTSCSKKTDSAPIRMFSEADTTEVLQHTDNFMKLVQAKEYDLAFNLLYNLKDDLSNYRPEQKEILKQQFQTFPVLAYKLEEYSFKHVSNVSVTYSYEIFEKDSLSNIPNTMRITFCPERRNNIWYLGLGK